MVYMWRREGASFLVSQRETASLVSGVNNNKDILNSCVFYIKQIKKKEAVQDAFAVDGYQSPAVNR